MKRSVWQGAALLLLVSNIIMPSRHWVLRFFTLYQCVVTLGISLQIASTLKPVDEL